MMWIIEQLYGCSKSLSLKGTTVEVGKKVDRATLKHLGRLGICYTACREDIARRENS